MTRTQATWEHRDNWPPQLHSESIHNSIIPTNDLKQVFCQPISQTVALSNGLPKAWPVLTWTLAYIPKTQVILPSSKSVFPVQTHFLSTCQACLSSWPLLWACRGFPNNWENTQFHSSRELTCHEQLGSQWSCYFLLLNPASKGGSYCPLSTR